MNQEKTIQNKPACAVGGFFAPKPGQKYGSMCGQIGAGGTKLCHYEGKCEHQLATQAAKQGENPCSRNGGANG